MKRPVFYSLVVLFLLLFSGVVLPAWLMRINMTAVRMDGTAPTPGDFGMSYEALSLASMDGVIIKAWYIPGIPGAPAVVMVHGKDASKTGFVHFARVINSMGYHVILPDLRGHGESGDGLLTFGLQEARDVEAAVEALGRRAGVDTGRIGVYAQSMGSAAAILALGRDPRCRGFFIDSGFDNLDHLIADVGTYTYDLPRWLALNSTWPYRLFTGVPASEVDPSGILSRSDRPLLLVHARDDRTIPFVRAQALYRSAAGRKKLVETAAGHTAAWGENPKLYERLLKKFFRGIFESESFDPGTLDLEKLATDTGCGC